MPRVYIVDTAMPNAFATGRDPKHAAIAVTTGITRILNLNELEGVLAHELAHIKNRDPLISTIAATIIQLAISRGREFGPDASGAKICGNPLSPANALAKQETGAGAMRADVNPSTAHMFIVNPLKGEKLATLFSTHPSTEERIA